MKKKTAAYLAIGIVGIALALDAKFLLQGFLSNVQSGAMVGVGAGLFGYGMGKGCVALWGEKHPDLMKQSEIEEKDERNVAIGNAAKAKGYDVMTFAFGAMLLFSVLMEADLALTLVMVAVYLFIQFYSLWWRFKLEKEM